MKRSAAILSLLLFMLLAGSVNADVFRYHGPAFDGTGNWEEIAWQNQTAGLDEQAPPGPADDTRINWAGGTCTLSTATTVDRVKTGVDEIGHLIIVSGGHLKARDGGDKQ